jgi:hypothetical protein
MTPTPTLPLQPARQNGGFTPFGALALPALTRQLTIVLSAWWV